MHVCVLCVLSVYMCVFVCVDISACMHVYVTGPAKLDQVGT